MTEMQRTFAVGERARIEAATTSGEIVVSPGPAEQVTVSIDGSSDEYLVEQRGDLITVKPQRGRLRRFSSADLHLEVPQTAAVALSCTSGDVFVNASVRDLEVGTASGDMRIGDVERSATLRSASGDVTIERVGERLDLTTASGDVRVGTVTRDVSINSASGDLTVDEVGEKADLKTASGNIDVRRFLGTDLTGRTLSGDVRIGLPARRDLEVDIQTLSGSLRNRLPAGDGSEPERSVVLRITTVSGDVTLRGAR
jgi:DUF4097 and DUF4098 domain-containing protein YvlB